MTRTLFKPVKKMALQVIAAHQVKHAEISFAFVDEEIIRRLNREYLHRDRVTDVIAFDLSASGDEEPAAPSPGPLVGDIYICVPRALDQAGQYQVPPEQELFRLSVHGLLHLLGYDHREKSRAGRMTRLQEELVDQYCVPPGGGPEQ